MRSRSPAVQTPALVEGIYHTTVRVATGHRAGPYWVYLRFGNRKVARRLSDARRRGELERGGSTHRTGCAGIGFTVLHNDHAGSAYLPAGGYKVSSCNMDCGTASAEFTSFLAGAGKSIPGWNTTRPAPAVRRSRSATAA